MSDPLTASYRTFPMGLFEQRFAQFHAQAVVVARQGAVPPSQWPESGVRVAVRGADDNLWVGTAATGWLNMGGTLVAAPAIVRRADGSALYLATGSDHQLWVRSETQPWTTLANGPVYCLDAPAAAVVDALLVVGCHGGDGALWVAKVAVPADALPAGGDFVPYGAQLWDGPAIAVIGGVVTYVANDPAGHVMTRTDATGWTPTVYWCVGHAALAVNGTSVLFTCHGRDEQQWYGIATNGFPQAAIPLGGHIIDGAGAAPSGGGFEIDATGTDLEAWSTHIEGANFSPWQPLGGRVIGGVGASA